MLPNLDKYISLLLDGGAFVARIIPAAEIITAPWVIMKCRYGCPRYGHSRSCPPFAPGWKETAEILGCYSRAIIFGVHSMAQGTPLALKTNRALCSDGFYRALAFGTGPCTRCAECKPDACPHPSEVLPSPEACGIDLVATVRAAGLSINMPPQPDAPLSCYALLLVD
ncbi:MAG: DUF2284 domain-containing protein [Muribaculaceae bacterium]|nr:DUF2284 domain-containing protein [Muribaculaceae bacterium]